MTVVSTLIAALATPALAGDVVVKLVGKTDAQIAADLRAAASQVCFEKLRGSPMNAYERMDCVRAVVADARAQISVKRARTVAD